METSSKNGKHKPELDWQKMHDQFAKAMTPDRRRELATAMGLPESALADDDIGFTSDSHGDCWTFTERDGAGNPIGIMRRYKDGSKKAWHTGTRGLFLPAGWADQTGPIYLPEGASDTLAHRAMGLCAIGRPNSTVGVDHLSGLLESTSAERPIVVLGEYDPKSDGRWPGRDGALLIACELTKRLGRSVRWALPPEGAKDVREWLTKRVDAGCLDELSQLGDRFVEALKLLNADEARPDSEPAAKKTLADRFGIPVLASDLQVRPPGPSHLRGCLRPDCITVFAALWKAGKSTWLAHFLRATAYGGQFCGLDVMALDVLYVTEENETLWAERRDKIGIRDNVRFLNRPFALKPGFPDWLEFIAYLEALQQQKRADLIVFDTLSNLWPVRNENDACEVQSALMPLRQLSVNGTSLKLVHHFGKGESGEATRTRGSGALSSFVDCILELRRFTADDREDRRRILTGYSRFDDTPADLVVELSVDGQEYRAVGTKLDATRFDRVKLILDTLPISEPGLTVEEIREAWPGDGKPTRKGLDADLVQGMTAGKWKRAGAGVKGQPFRYWRDALP